MPRDAMRSPFGPSLKDLMGPPLKDLMGPPLKDLMGPPLKDLMGPPLKDLMGPPLNVRFAEVFSSPALSTDVFRDFKILATSLTAGDFVALTLGSLDDVDDTTAAALGSFAEAFVDASDAARQTLSGWAAQVGAVPRAKLILHASAAIGALLKFFDTPESTHHPGALAINILTVLIAVGWLLYTVHESEPEP